jgi:hypothetical protein
MKRDIDLCRQLLLDLEAHGPECAINTLRSGLATEADDRLRYHVRLLVDAGFVKELERHATNVTYVRLTNSGVEFLELCRSDARWRDAKAVVLDRTGGQSLTVIRTLLTKWAVEAVNHGYARVPRRAYRPLFRREEARRQFNGVRYDRDLVEIEDDLRLVRTAPDYRERGEVRDRLYDSDYYYNGAVVEPESLEPNVGVQLPIYLV